MKKVNSAKTEDGERARSFRFGVAFGQFSARASEDTYNAVRNVLSELIQKELPTYEELKKTVWWEFDPDPFCFDDGCYQIGLLAYLRFVLSLPGHQDIEKQNQQIQQTEAHLREEFNTQSHPMKILDDFLFRLKDDPNEALRIFVDKFASCLVSDVAILVTQGESDTVEFKSTLKLSDNASEQGKENVKAEIAKSVAGFLNSPQGGNLIVGVNDKGEPTGDLLEKGELETEDRASLYLIDILKSRLGINAVAQTRHSFDRIDGKLVLVVHCIYSIDKFPVFVSEDQPPPNRIFYVRIGPTTQQLDGEDQLNYIDSVRNQERRAGHIP